jgi:uncharacterized protein (TIGR03792 family)
VNPECDVPADAPSFGKLVGVIVEELTFVIEPAELESWLAREAAVWDEFLRAQPGFVRKEVWRPVDDQRAVRVLVWWQSERAWRAVPSSATAALDERMGELYRPSTARSLEVLRQ